MLAAGLIAVTFILAVIVMDWVQFTSLTVPASRYGCRVAHLEDRLPQAPWSAIAGRFDRNGVLHLPHGIARVFEQERRILLRPQYGLFSRRFRTAWPLNAAIEVRPDGEATRLTCIKRMPWSSAVLTLLWFGVVGLGTVAFLVAYLVNGGLSSLAGVLMGMGILGLGVLVLAFGLVTVSLAYRLEDQRLTLAYQELRRVLEPGATAPA